MSADDETWRYRLQTLATSGRSMRDISLGTGLGASYLIPS